MDIEIREFLEERPHGDRAIHMSPSSRFEVWGDVSGHGDWKKLNTFDQYDHVNSSVGDRNMTYKVAKLYALDIAHGDNVDHVVYTPKVITEWIRGKVENVG